MICAIREMKTDLIERSLIAMNAVTVPQSYH